MPPGETGPLVEGDPCLLSSSPKGFLTAVESPAVPWSRGGASQADRSGQGLGPRSQGVPGGVRYMRNLHGGWTQRQSTAAVGR